MKISYGNFGQRRLARCNAGTTDKYRVCIDGEIQDRKTGKILGYIIDQDEIERVLKIKGIALTSYLDKFFKKNS